MLLCTHVGNKVNNHGQKLGYYHTRDHMRKAKNDAVACSYETIVKEFKQYETYAKSFEHIWITSNKFR